MVLPFPVDFTRAINEILLEIIGQGSAMNRIDE
jgi:hypothetical protein